MPFALIFIGLIMVVSGARDTHVQLGAQIRTDAVPFMKWVAAIGTLGAIGYVPAMRQLSHYMMALVIISMLLANRGFFAKLQEAINSGPDKITPASGTATTAQPASASKTPSIADDTGAFGQPADSQGQAKANRYLNFIFKNLLGIQ